MSNNKHELVLYRRKRVAEMYVRGKWQTEMAQILDVHVSVISRDLAWIHDLWLANIHSTHEVKQARELAHLDAIEREAWEAWEASKAPDKTVSVERNQATQFPGTKRKRQYSSSHGNPDYLALALKCIDKRCQILGLDAPQRLRIDWESLSYQQIERLARGEPATQVLAEGPQAQLPPPIEAVGEPVEEELPAENEAPARRDVHYMG